MGIETFEYIDDLNAANPTATDNVSEGDDHLRGLKTTLKNTFPNVTGAINATDTELNYVDGVTSSIQTQIDNIDTDVVNDTTPQLGGDLDLNGNDITGTGDIPAGNLTGTLPAIDGSSLTGVQPFPSGTVMVFYQASAPTGWTKSTSQNNKALRVVSGTGGGSGGSWDLSSGDTSSSTGAHTHTGPSHTHSTPSHSHSHSLSAGSHTLSTSQMPSHNHTRFTNYGSNGWGGTTLAKAKSRNYGEGPSQWNTTGMGSTGGGSSHSHSLSGSITSGGSGTSGSGGTGNTSSNGSHTHTISAPKYIDVIVCSKD